MRWLSKVCFEPPGAIDFWTGVATALLAVVDHFLPRMQLMTEYAWQIALWAAVGVVIMRIFKAPYLLAKESDKKIAELENKLSIRAKLSVDGPFLHTRPPTNYWRIVIRNEGEAAAKNVTVKLLGIHPRPQYGTWASDYPYPVNKVVESNLECKINTHDHADFEILSGWPNGEGHMFTDGLDTKTTGHKNYIGIDPDERWTLAYEVTSENADSIGFSVSVTVKDKRILMERI